MLFDFDPKHARFPSLETLRHACQKGISMGRAYAARDDPLALEDVSSMPLHQVQQKRGGSGPLVMGKPWGFAYSFITMAPCRLIIICGKGDWPKELLKTDTDGSARAVRLA